MSYAAKAVEGMRHGFSFLAPPLRDLAPGTPLCFSRGHFTVKIAKTRRELWQVYKLRYDVFHREYKHKKFPFGLDRDRFDEVADHLIIIDDRIDRVVGTYRMINSKESNDFYSATEFDISELLAYEGHKVELSRACIHKEYRNGATITLLWRGLCEYLALSGARWMFGLGSLKTTDVGEAADVFSHLRDEGAVNGSLNIPAIDGYKMKTFKEMVDRCRQKEDMKCEIPSLLRSYIRAGAVIAPDAALDRDFNCVDFFVILDTSKISEKYCRKYQIH